MALTVHQSVKVHALERCLFGLVQSSALFRRLVMLLWRHRAAAGVVVSPSRAFCVRRLRHRSRVQPAPVNNAICHRREQDRPTRRLRT